MVGTGGDSMATEPTMRVEVSEPVELQDRLHQDRRHSISMSARAPGRQADPDVSCAELGNCRNPPRKQSLDRHDISNARSEAAFAHLKRLSTGEDRDSESRVGDDDVQMRSPSGMRSIAAPTEFSPSRQTRGASEFAEVRMPALPGNLTYTPVMTNEATDFTKLGYRCRFVENEIDVFIVITMYNEGRDELVRTLRGVCENLQTYCERTLDEEFYRKICVCIVSDGRRKANQDTLLYATELGIFSRDAVKYQIQKFDGTGMHLFESTVMLPKVENLGTCYPPLNVMFALKEYNAGKINSHWWYFTAFAQQIQPKYCMLLDVGTRPLGDALYYLFETMERNDQIAGCCGEITTDKTFNFMNPLVAAQTLEYKVANYFDKTFESNLGFISVLPGAFSAYRYEALKDQPLEKYFHHLKTTPEKLSAFKANMYLAEDRILCFELLAKRDHKYTLHYDSRAIAETDAPGDLVSLIKQRRRWLNGSLFATLYVVLHLHRFLAQSRHSFIRKFFITLQNFYYAMQLLLIWFLVPNFYLIFFFSMDVILGRQAFEFAALRYLFLALTVVQFVLGLGNKPHGARGLYNLCCVLYGLFFITTSALSLYTLLRGDLGLALLIGVSISSGVILVAAFLHGQLLAVVANGLQYLFFMPAFVVMFPIYSFCNIHDISWGTKGSEDAFAVKDVKSRGSSKLNIDERVRARLERIALLKQQEAQANESLQLRFERFRSYLLIFWLCSTGLYISLLTQFELESRNQEFATWFLRIMFVVLAVGNTVRFLGSTLYIFLNVCPSRRAMRRRPKYPKVPGVPGARRNRV